MTVSANATIGDLFPHDNSKARWVFSLSVVADELMFLLRAMEAAMSDPRNLRQAMHFQRALIVRSFEARRIVEAAVDDEQIAVLLGDMAAWEKLKALYSPHGSSVVDEMFAVVRHNSVHSMWSDSDELQQALAASRKLPARLRISERDGRQVLEADWTQVVAGLGLFGEISSNGWEPKFEERTRSLTELVVCWIVVHGAVLLMYAKSIGMDLRRVVVQDDP